MYDILHLLQSFHIYLIGNDQTLDRDIISLFEITSRKSGFISNIDNVSNALNLYSKIQKYNEAYYQNNDSLIPDQEYDNLYQQFVNTISADANLSLLLSDQLTVGYQASTEFKKIKHIIPMLSLQNAFSEEDIQSFINQIQRFLKISYVPAIVAELKIDGVSFSAVYDNGKLKYATTRGNGIEGEDITSNALHIIPTWINYSRFLEVRGEIYAPKHILTGDFSNLRNYASGSLRQLDSDITKSRNLQYFVYQCFSHNQTDAFIDHHQSLMLASEIGFIINKQHIVSNSIEDLLAFYKKITSERDNLDYEIDGIVYKINDLALQTRLSSTSHHPRWAIAYKFASSILPTTLEKIEYSISRSGTITPVAILKPLDIHGVIIRKASLHNFAEISRLGINEGDTVLVKRAGDVIPKVVGSTTGSNKSSIKIPEYCPSCNSKLTYSGQYLKCTNHSSCIEIIKMRISHFVSKPAFNIDGLGQKTISTLVKIGILKDPIDLFSLQQQEPLLLSIPGFGRKTISKLLEEIDIAKNITLDRLIYALGIEHIGQNHAKVIANQFTDFDDWDNKMHMVYHGQEKLLILASLNNIGEKITDSIIKYYSEEHNINTLEKLKLHLTIKHQDSVPRITSKISGKK